MNEPRPQRPELATDEDVPTPHITPERFRELDGLDPEPRSTRPCDPDYRPDRYEI